MVTIKELIREVPDFPKPGINFKDITPLLADPHGFQSTLYHIHDKLYNVHFNTIAAVESRGFILGAALATQLRLPLVLMRKPGKLPCPTYSQEYSLEYGKSEMHVHTDAIEPGAEVLIVDDLLATGGTVEACCKLVEKCGGVVAGCLFVVELNGLKGRERLGKPVYSLLEY